MSIHEIDLVAKALEFATKAHKGQLRKYTGEPYVNHCIAVAGTVAKVDGRSDSMIAAALLHDTVEDTDTTIEDIKREFGEIVAIFVDGLTDISKPEDGKRKIRKEIDRQHLKDSLPPIQTIKLADLIDNSASITEYDQGFAKVYMSEKRLLLEVLTEGDQDLHIIASGIVSDYYNFELLEETK